MAAQGFLLIATFLLVLMVLARPLGSGLARLINDIPLPGTAGVERMKRRTKNAKTFHDKCENFNFRASNETAALTAVFLFITWGHFGYG